MVSFGIPPFGSSRHVRQVNPPVSEPLGILGVREKSAPETKMVLV